MFTLSRMLRCSLLKPSSKQTQQQWNVYFNKYNEIQDTTRPSNNKKQNKNIFIISLTTRNNLSLFYPATLLCGELVYFEKTCKWDRRRSNWDNLAVLSSYLLSEWQTSSETPEAALEVKRAKAFAVDCSADSGGLFYCTKTSRMKHSGGRRVTGINGESLR